MQLSLNSKENLVPWDKNISSLIYWNSQYVVQMFDLAHDFQKLKNNIETLWLNIQEPEFKAL